MTRREALFVLVGLDVAAVVLAVQFGLPRLAQAVRGPVVTQRTFTFKTTPQGELAMDVFYPPSWTAQDRRPAIVLFFGGGWATGERRHMHGQAEYFAQRGLVAAAADYRTYYRHGTAPDACVEDGKSAIRWMRRHADMLGVDPQRLAAGGRSAGGHVAACAALCPYYDAPGEDVSVSAQPAALVLWYPVLDTTDLDHVRLMGGATVPEQAVMAGMVSPLHLLSRAAPPTLLLYGSDDYLLPGGSWDYWRKARGLGSRCELFLAPRQWHGFSSSARWGESCLRQADRFLVSLGWLEGAPTAQAGATYELVEVQPGEEMKWVRESEEAGGLLRW